MTNQTWFSEKLRYHLFGTAVSDERIHRYQSTQPQWLTSVSLQENLRGVSHWRWWWGGRERFTASERRHSRRSWLEKEKRKKTTEEAFDRIWKRTSKQSRKRRFLQNLRFSQLKTEKKHREEFALPAWMLDSTCRADMTLVALWSCAYVNLLRTCEAKTQEWIHCWTYTTWQDWRI